MTKNIAKLIPNKFTKTCVGDPLKNRVKGLFYGYISCERLRDVSKRKAEWLIRIDCLSAN